MESVNTSPVLGKQCCQFLAFPLERQTGKVRDVARKLSTKTTDRHADSYRDQVTEALARRLQRLSVPRHESTKQIGRFWSAVDLEILRLSHVRRSGGAA